MDVSLIRSGSLIGVFLICMILQWIIPSRKFEKDRWKYMVSNIVLVVCNNLILLLMPLVPYQASIYANNHSIGLLNLFDIGVSELVVGFFSSILLFIFNTVFSIKFPYFGDFIPCIMLTPCWIHFRIAISSH